VTERNVALDHERRPARTAEKQEMALHYLLYYYSFTNEQILNFTSFIKKKKKKIVISETFSLKIRNRQFPLSQLYHYIN
jgi:hypothetical protein